MTVSATITLQYLLFFGHLLWLKAICHVVSILIWSLETDLARKEVLIDNTSLYQTCQRATLGSMPKTLARSLDASCRAEFEHVLFNL